MDTTKTSTSDEVGHEDQATGKNKNQDVDTDTKCNLDLTEDEDLNSDDDIELRWDDDEIDEDAILNDEPFCNTDKPEATECKNHEFKDNSEGFVSIVEKSNTTAKDTGDSNPEQASVKGVVDKIEEMCNNILENIQNKSKNKPSGINNMEINITADKVLEDKNQTASNNENGNANIVDQKVNIENNEKLCQESTLEKCEESPLENYEESSTFEKEQFELDASTNKSDSDDIIRKINLISSTLNESIQDESMFEGKVDHGLNKPDMMLEIPTQEIIDFMDDIDDASQCDLSSEDDSTKNNDIDIQPEKTEINYSHIDLEKDVSIDDINDENYDKNQNENEQVKTNICEKDSDLNVCSPNSNIEINANSIKAEPTVEVIVDETTKHCLDTVINEVDTNIDELGKSDDISEEKHSSMEVDKKENDPKDDERENVMSIENISTVGLKEQLIEKQSIVHKKAPSTSYVQTSSNNDNNLTIKPNESPNIDEQENNVTTIDKNSDINEVNKQLVSEELNTDLEIPTQSVDDLNLVKPSTSIEKQSTINEQQQSALDKMVEITEDADSLGLLAESRRVIDDDEEVDEDEDGDDDEDFDQDDESSNQMTVENSEDSNAQHSESDTKDIEKEVESPKVENEDFSFAITNVTGGEKDIEIEEGENEDVDMTTEVNIADDNIETTETSLQDADDEPMKEVSPETGETQIAEPALVEADTLPETSSDVQDKAEECGVQETLSVTGQIDPEEKTGSTEDDKSKLSPSKSEKLEISQQKHIVNIVDLEESSEEDDVQEVKKECPAEQAVEQSSSKEEVTSVNIPSDIEVMAIGGDTSDIVSKEGELVISGLPKPPPLKPARLNTSEVTIKTTSTVTDSTLVIPETKSPKEDTTKPKLGLQIFNLDSDEEDATAATPKETPQEPPPECPKTAPDTERPREPSKCINDSCRTPAGVAHYPADAAAVAYYDAARKRRAVVCLPCADVVANRTRSLVNGIKEFTPLLDLDMTKLSQELVEISDSESEDEADIAEEPKETIGEAGAKLLEEQLADIINGTWKKYKLDARLSETEEDLNKQLSILEEESKEIDTMLNECQVATDKLRSELYATFEGQRRELPSLIIFDTPNNVFTSTESVSDNAAVNETRLKRRLTSVSDSVSKRPAIPLGYAPLDASASATADSKELKNASLDSSKIEDDKDISVVKLSAEAAPADLPPPGITRPPLRVGMAVYAMRNVFSSWSLAVIIEVQPKINQQFTIYRVKFETSQSKSLFKIIPARFMAYVDPADFRLTIGTRVIALFKDTDNIKKKDSFYSGVIAEVPNPVNNYRYLVFFDDGYAQYVRHSCVRPVVESAPLVWEEVPPCSRDFVHQYLAAYPERPMVRLHAGQSLQTEWNGKWWSSRVIQVDASLVQVHFEEDNRTEWIYRGSTRLAPLYLELQAAERHRARPLPRSKQHKTNMPYVEYTRSEENKAAETSQTHEEFRRQRAVAKKSTAIVNQPIPQAPAANLDSVTSRVVYYTPKNAVKPYKMLTHNCSPKCKRTDVLALKDLRTYNPLAKPLLSGWERQIVRYKGHKEVMYRAPCGRRLRNLAELHRYLSMVQSDMPVDLFDFGPATHCLAEFVLNKCLVGKKDLSHGKENVPVPCVNYYDESLPEFCSYNTERTPTAGVPLNLDPEFLCGCDCTDDCQDKSRCACWQMTLEGARTIGLRGPHVGYSYRRLPEPLPSGIYECNSRCKCKKTCLNRVAQHPLQLKLQVFKTLNRGWGIRALNDVPKGSFLCVYAGNLLTDATANLDGLNEGDEYLAELDYIEVVEQMKEGYEEDIPEADKILDKGDGNEDDEEDPSSSSDEETKKREEQEDGDFQPGYIGPGVQEFNKRLRKRDKAKQDKENAAAAEKEKVFEKEKENDEDCITISDDEEVRKPSRFMAQAGMKSNEFISKYRSVRSLFGEDEACYIMDAKVQGNIGRYLNHSCTPNVFVQNVFVDTHDPRFPWVAFFALSHIRAGTELTWNYNYDVGSVPGKVLYCYCGAPNCRGRLL
ncbi:LOW QUALITY PROTEIN: SET domain bifurcated histone lysine methyltransferase eggless [Aphomia sociella]